MTDKQRQNLLQYLGYYDGIPDGEWGPKSREACRRFQEDFGGLDTDGYGGPDTDKALKQSVADDLCRSRPDSSFWDHIRYWKREEFRCRCSQYHAPYCSGYPVEPDQTLVELADDLRARFGRPGHASSGVRCTRHNADQPGAAVNSRHLLGKALDFYIEGVSGETLCSEAASDPRCRYAYVISGNYIHVDVH